MNRVILRGRVGKDPETYTFDNGNKKALFSLATSEKYKDRDGNKQEETEWHNIVIFGKLAELVEKYVRKGDNLLLEGKKKTRSYETDQGTRYATEIICHSMEMLGSPNRDSQPQAQKELPSQVDGQGEDKDDLPF